MAILVWAADAAIDPYTQRTQIAWVYEMSDLTTQQQPREKLKWTQQWGKYRNISTNIGP